MPANLTLFNVVPAVPPELRFLEELAHNLWWCWHQSAIELFRRIDPLMWKQSGHNPVRFLNTLPQQRLQELASDNSFLAHLRDVADEYARPPCDNAREWAGADAGRPCVAYFSLEYGIHESVRIYSGGLGILAGDHLKSSSDLDMPLVAVGLMYRQGFFQQSLDAEGLQHEHYPENRLCDLPVEQVIDQHGHETIIGFDLPEGHLKAMLWRLRVGRISLFLLDTNIPQNPPAFHNITATLYDQDPAIRLRQEMLLGIGGYKALLAMGYSVQACHMNEGHAAFLSLARIDHLVTALGMERDVAIEVVRRTNIFTTHTPVPAGNETFKLSLIKPHLEALKPTVYTVAEVLDWGQGNGTSHDELSMTVLGLRMAYYNNGVSALHGEVARDMWAHLWDDYSVDEIPIDHVTNGIHVASFLSHRNATLYTRYLGEDWLSTDPAKQAGALARIVALPDDRLWQAHEANRASLIRFCRDMLEQQLIRRKVPQSEMHRARSVLDHDALTIGFARRFATYKRATLLLRDPDRFEALLCNPERPVQFVFAGKAHPADQAGKALIKQLIDFVHARPSVANRLVFIENYDIRVARHMVQGVDVWLNTPRHPQEASGTSGMKAAANGALNLSILDGWWCEGYDGTNGWAIDGAGDYENDEYQDESEALMLFDLLENQVIPLFYDRQIAEFPHRWIAMMRRAISTGLQDFNSHRMVLQYYERFYTHAITNYATLTRDNAFRARALVKQRAELQNSWPQVKVELPVACIEGAADLSILRLGDTLSISTIVHLGILKPEEVVVEAYYGPVSSKNTVEHSASIIMDLVAETGPAAYRFTCQIECKETGRYGFTTRVLPAEPGMLKLMPGFITWGTGVDDAS